MNCDLEIKFNEVEKTNYYKLKKQAKQGWLMFAEAITVIHNKKLYRVEYDTFEEFCNTELNITKRHTYRIMDSVKVIENLKSNPRVTLPEYEKHARPLKKLEPELQKVAWQDVVESNEPEKITAKVIEETINNYKELNTELKEVKERPLFVANTEEDIIKKAKELQQEKTKEKKEKLSQIKERILQQTKSEILINPLIELTPAKEFLKNCPYCNLLITDPPYFTEFENEKEFENFINNWYYDALNKVFYDGRAYIFIGAYPSEVKLYLNAKIPEHLKLEQILIWTYRNTLGNNPKDRYKQNYQMCLYFKGMNANDLDCPLTNEQWSVQDINAPDGRLGDRYHSWQKPLEIGERFIRHSTKEGDIIIDPFAGTGTFLIAASKLNRKSYGCDISKSALYIAKERGCVLNENKNYK